MSEVPGQRIEHEFSQEQVEKGVSIGRNPESSIRIPDTDGNRDISRKHVFIQTETINNPSGKGVLQSFQIKNISETQPLWMNGVDTMGTTPNLVENRAYKIALSPDVGFEVEFVTDEKDPSKNKLKIRKLNKNEIGNLGDRYSEKKSQKLPDDVRKVSF